MKERKPEDEIEETLQRNIEQSKEVTLALKKMLIELDKQREKKKKDKL